MIRIHVKLVPLTPYNISASLKTGERKVMFYFGSDPSFKFIPPTTIKGLLRTAACYTYFEGACETVTAKILLSNLDFELYFPLISIHRHLILSLIKP
ncbi:MAG: hypothetical protein RXQ80_09050 [Sulfolobaceae archaeon]